MYQHLTNHIEVVRIIYDPLIIPYSILLKIFWESHNPTQGMRQGKDVGTQYRSAIFYYDESQKQIANNSLNEYQNIISDHYSDKLLINEKRITTEILDMNDKVNTFYYAEEEHQQFLFKNPDKWYTSSMNGLGIDCGIKVPKVDRSNVAN